MNGLLDIWSYPSLGLKATLSTSEGERGRGEGRGEGCIKLTRVRHAGSGAIYPLIHPSFHPPIRLSLIHSSIHPLVL